MAIPPNEPGPSNAPMIYIPIVVFSIVSPMLCGLRVWARFRKSGKLGVDDYLILAALTFALASSGVMIASCQYGFGQHMANLTSENKIEVLKYFYLCQITYKLSINLTKCSILTLYIRIFGANIRWIFHLCTLLIAIIASYCVATVLATIFQCTPLPFAFDKTIIGHCIDNAQFWFANASFNIATDVIILLIPIPPVYRLLIPRVHKIALILVFMLGGFVTLTSCLRMTTINIAATSPDSTYEIASTMWTLIEMNLAIVCACLPMAWSLLPLVHGLGTVGSRYTAGPEGRLRGKAYMKSRSHDGSGQGGWARVEGKDGVHVASVQTGDQSSEEYFLNQTGRLEEGRETGIGGIQKTVQYSVHVEYVALGVNAVGGGM
ncbi:hypothetical protein OQA88_943 [Cercophora sp. LCS_1]